MFYPLGQIESGPEYLSQKVASPLGEIGPHSCLSQGQTLTSSPSRPRNLRVQSVFCLNMSVAFAFGSAQGRNT